MKNTILLPLAVMILVCWFNHGMAQSLNGVRIGNCPTKPVIDGWIAMEQAKGLVMDARPFAINQAKGKLLFTRGAGRVSVIHMNPFVYNYKISVAQQELVSTAVTEFLKLILPPNLQLSSLQSGDTGKAVAAKASNKVTELETRLNTLNTAGCHAPAGAGPEVCQATTEMLRIFNLIKPELQPASTIVQQLDNSQIINNGGGVVGPTNVVYVTFTNNLSDLRNEQLEAFDTCNRAQLINLTLGGYDFKSYFNGLNNAQSKISMVESLAEDLKQLGEDYNKDKDLKDKPPRCNGFNCTNQFLQYADAVKALIGTGGYQHKLDDLRQKGREMQTMFALTEAMKTKDGLFARSFDVEKKFELSQATITVKRELVEGQGKQTTQTQSGEVNTGTTNPVATNPIANGGSSEGTVGDSLGPKFVSPGIQRASVSGPQAAPDSIDTGQTGTATPFAGEVNEVVQLGRPRFMLSGGMVYSPLPRRTFKKTTGFVLDAQGTPTGKGDASVVGFGQDSPRRLFPMVFLNSRLLDYDYGSLYFSFGVTGKKDDNVDLEYLFGPSVSFLNDRALFTFGAYGGMTQKLVSDVRIGQEIPDAVGDAKLFRKGMTWKPGFSFSYNFSGAKKIEAKSGGGKTSSAEDDLKSEIRIGSIPFNLALGLVVTSLEQRTYDPIVGFARDSQGNLTNGQTLARIVGLTSSSNYRLSPMAMLHSRLTNFGSHDFYFTGGITGKKTKDDFDVEYLLGGSTNLFQRKIFLTFGTFIGKQTVLASGFFEGQALKSSQGVTTVDRYVWKPAIGFSYDISKIISRPN